MVVSLGPGKFYGSSLPRPRFYTDVKLSHDGVRVDPPLAVLDPLLSWAQEAHWSMGGLSFKRHRLQGRIEGSIKRLRAQGERKERTVRRERKAAKKESSAKMKLLAVLEEEEEVDLDLESEQESEQEEERVEESLVVESQIEAEEEGQEKQVEEREVAVPVADVEAPARSSPRLKKRARSLRGEFDRVASGLSFGESIVGVSGSTSPSNKSGSSMSGSGCGESRRAAPVTSTSGRRKRIRLNMETPTPTRRSPRISPTKCSPSI